MFEKERGSTLLYAIFAIIAVAAIASAIASITPNTSVQLLNDIPQKQAFYAAASGYNYLKALNKDQLDLIVSDGGSVTFTIDQSTKTKFTAYVSAGVKTGSRYSYPVAVLGSSSDSSYLLGNLTDGVPGNSLPPVKPPIVSSPPDTIYAKNTFNFSGSLYTGNYTMSSSTFNGGVVVDGSINYKGTDCLSIRGNRVGKTDGTSIICADKCVTIDGNVSVYGTITTPGDVYINNGTVYGNIYSGGDVYIRQWNGWVKKIDGNGGNVYAYGNISAADMSIEGLRIDITEKPNACNDYTLPEHKVVSPGMPNPSYASYIFTGGNIEDTSYAFTSLSTNGGAKTCFDLSVPNTYINIFISEDLNFNSSIYIKTDSRDCFNPSNKITTSNYMSDKFINASKRIYMDVNGRSNFGGDGHAWVGTLYSRESIITQGGFISVGSLYSNDSININGGSYSYFTMSDYVTTYW